MIKGICLFLIIISFVAVFSVEAQQKGHKKIPVSAKTLKNSNEAVIGSVKLQVNSAKLAESYEGVQGYSPKSSDEALLVIHIELLSETKYDTLKNMKNNCYVIDDKDTKSLIAGEETEYRRAPGDTSNKLAGAIWIFLVRKSSSSFRLILPENKVIKLDALISSSKKID